MKKDSFMKDALVLSLITLIYNLIQHMSHRDLSNKRIPSSQHG